MQSLQQVPRTNYETTGTEESVHWVQSPCQNFLEIWCHLPDNEIEEPVGGGRQRYTLRANRKWHDLIPSSKGDKMSNGMHNRPRVDTAMELGPNYQKKTDEWRPRKLFAKTDLYPNAALKMITQTTTAFGVCGTSMYIQYPVATSAALICHFKVTFKNSIQHLFQDIPRPLQRAELCAVPNGQQDTIYSS